jgi:hypothetical protein
MNRCMTRSPILFVVLTTLLALTPLGLASASAQATDPHYAEPTVGECHDYSYKGLNHRSDSSPAVVCDGTQTAQTFAVVDLPRRVKLSDPDLFKYVGPTCDKKWKRALGGAPTTWALSAYYYGWFVPTKAEQRQGAHWVRCDAVLFGGRNKLAPVPVSLKLGSPPLDDAVARCLESKGHQSFRTVCDRRHDFRSKKALQLRGSRYPTQQQFGATAARGCGRLYFVPPTEDQWNAGFKILICYDKTTH